MLMNFFKKSLTLIITGVLLFTSAVPFSYALEPDQRRSIQVRFEDISTRKTDLFSFLQSCTALVNLLTKNRNLPDNALDVEFDDGVEVDLCNFIFENTDLDIINLFQHIPFGTDALNFVYDTTDTDTAAIRSAVYEIRNKCNENGQYTLANVFYFFGTFLSGIDNIHVYTRPYGNDGASQVCLKITFIDGGTENFGIDIFFSKDGIAYGSNGKGILALGYECSVYDLLIYTTVDCWMHKFGFCALYDTFCYATPFFNYITRRFKFEYDSKEWMVQVWKGNYFITNGAEVGIYSRPLGSAGTFYNCYDGVMNMSLALSADGETVFERECPQWWISGFKLSRKLYSPLSMTVDFSIELLSTDMAKAFCESVNSGYMRDAVCRQNGKTVYVTW